MRKVIGTFFVISIVSTFAVAGCAADTDESPSVEEGDLTSSVHVPATGSVDFELNAKTDADVVLTVDCKPPSDPDTLGPVVKLSSDTLGISESGRAGFFVRTGAVPAGTHTLTLAGKGQAATCTVKTSPVAKSATCRAWTEWRSVNMNHTHFQVGTDTSSDWESFPASGNHWGAWAKWNTDYAKPVKHGFLLHDLEHGGIVFSYKCASSTASAACKDAHDQLASIASSLGEKRFIVTPDPSQPTMFAVRAWRYAYTADCLDETSALAFAKAHVKHGREDIDADPPIPFDPTTLNVPCQDLMAAPDSCPE